MEKPVAMGDGSQALIGCGVQHQIAVVAKRATHIAASRKYCAGYLPGIIQKRRFLKSVYFHFVLLYGSFVGLIIAHINAFVQLIFCNILS